MRSCAPLSSTASCSRLLLVSQSSSHGPRTSHPPRLPCQRCEKKQARLDSACWMTLHDAPIFLLLLRIHCRAHPSSISAYALPCLPRRASTTSSIRSTCVCSRRPVCTYTCGRRCDSPVLFIIPIPDPRSLCSQRRPRRNVHPLLPWLAHDTIAGVALAATSCASLWLYCSNRQCLPSHGPKLQRRSRSLR